MKHLFVIILLSTALFACENANVIEEEAIDNKLVRSELTISKRIKKLQEGFKTIPSPQEIVIIFRSQGIYFKDEITNDPSNCIAYISNVKKALNLGVYGADLIYVNVFGQSEQSKGYIDCAKQIAYALNITSVINGAIIERIENNINNRDSLMIIMEDAFWIIDTHLNDNGQDHLSALIMVGAWIEGIYLCTKMLDRENPNTELMQRIANQKFSLKGVINLLVTYDNGEIVEVKRELKPLGVIYAKIDENAIDQKLVFEIVEEVAKIRAQFIR